MFHNLSPRTNNDVHNLVPVHDGDHTPHKSLDSKYPVLAIIFM